MDKKLIRRQYTKFIARSAQRALGNKQFIDFQLFKYKLIFEALPQLTLEELAEKNESCPKPSKNKYFLRWINAWGHTYFLIGVNSKELKEKILNIYKPVVVTIQADINIELK